MRRNWSEHNPEYLALTDLEVRLEILRISFYDLAESKRMKNDKSPITISEVEGDEAFQEWVDAGMPDDDWEPLT